MPTGPVTTVVPHDKCVLLAVQKSSLDEMAAEKLMDEVQTEAANAGGKPVVLDLSRVRFAPSVALGTLVKLTRSFQLDGRRLVLVGVDPRVRGAMQVTRLEDLLEIRDSIDQVKF